MAPDGRAETCSWEVWVKIYFNNWLIESCVRLYFIFIYLYYCGPGSSVCITTELQAGRSGIESRWYEIFRRPDRPWGPPSLLHNGYRVFPGVKYGRAVLLTTHPLLVPWSWKSRAIPLPTLWATTWPVTGTLYLFYLYTRWFKYDGTDVCVNKPHCAAAVRPWDSEATTSTLSPARVRTCSVPSGSC